MLSSDWPVEMPCLSLDIVIHLHLYPQIERRVVPQKENPDAITKRKTDGGCQTKVTVLHCKDTGKVNIKANQEL